MIFICFNLIFTSLPLAVKGIIDIDFNPSDGKVIYLLQPYLYLEGRDYPKFTIINFILELIKGIFHSIMNYIICIHCCKDAINSFGHIGCLWYNSVLLYTNIIIIVSIDLIVLTKYHTFINFLTMILTTFFLYFIFLIMVHNLSMFNSEGTMQIAFSSGKSWLIIILVTGISFISELGLLAFKTLFIKNVRNYAKLMKNKNDISDIEKKIKDLIDEGLKPNNKSFSVFDEEEENILDITNGKRNNDIIKKESSENILQVSNTLRSASLNINNKILKDEEFILPEKEEKEEKKETNRNVKSNFSIIKSECQNEESSKM